MIVKLIVRLCLRQSSVRRHLHSSVGRTQLSNEMAKPEGLQLETVVEILEKFAPKSLAESWDNTGLLVEPFTPKLIKRILLTNDLTEDVVLEARTVGCEMIISYHPPIFAPLKSVTQRSWKERVVSMLLEGGTALYSPHTSWDAVEGGVNDWLASALPVASAAPVVPGDTPTRGAGRLCQLSQRLQLAEVVSCVKRLTGLRHVRVGVARGRSLSSEVGSVALCAGSGGSVLKGVEADVYLTGEMLHHDVLEATQRGVSVLLTNHSDSERGFLRVFSTVLTAAVGDRAEVHISTADRDPLTTV